MILWRLCGADYVERFDGGYGLQYDGRWNSKGWPVTYCATSPSLCILEKLVHIEDPRLMPDDLYLVRYEAPDAIDIDVREVKDLPKDWRRNEAVTQDIGDGWLKGVSAALLSVPSVIVPIEDTKDGNVVINHRHPDERTISRLDQTPFELDPRLVSF